MMTRTTARMAGVGSTSTEFIPIGQHMPNSFYCFILQEEYSTKLVIKISYIDSSISLLHFCYTKIIASETSHENVAIACITPLALV